MSNETKPTMHDLYVVRMLFCTTDDSTEKRFLDYDMAAAYFQGCVDAICSTPTVALVSLRNEATDELVVETGVNFGTGHWMTDGAVVYTDGDGFKNYDLNLYKVRFN